MPIVDSIEIIAPMIVADYLAFASPTTTQVGVPIGFTVKAYTLDQIFNPSFSGTVHFTSSDGLAVLPGPSTLTSGVGVFSVTLRTVGSQLVFGTDNAGTTGTSLPIAVVPVPTTNHFEVDGPLSASANSGIAFTVIAEDSSNTTMTNYTGVVLFTSSDSAAVLPSPSGLTSGVGIFSATFVTVGNQTITATDQAVSSITGSSGSISVSSSITPEEDAVRLLVVPQNATGDPSGTVLQVTVTALDVNNLVVTTYAGTVTITSTDSAASLPAAGTLTNGRGVFVVTLNTVGAQTIFANGDTKISGSGGVIVTPTPTTHYSVTAPSQAAVGSPITVTVQALDANNHITTAYVGTVHFTSTDNLAALPGNATLTNGQGTFSLTYNSSGPQTVTATDLTSASITGSATSTVTSVGSVANFAVTSPGFFFGYVGTAFTVAAKDAAGNTVASYNGTVAFTSSDGCTATKLPANATLVNGVGVFSATLCSPLSQIITATDTVHATLTGASGSITVGGIYLGQHFVEAEPVSSRLITSSSPDGATFHVIPNANYGVGQQALGGEVRDPQPLQYGGKLWCAHTLIFSMGNGVLPFIAMGLVSSTDGEHWTRVAGTGPTGSPTLGYVDVSKYSSDVPTIGGTPTGFDTAWAPDWQVDVNGDVYLTFTANIPGQARIPYYLKCKTNPADMTAWSGPFPITGLPNSNFSFAPSSNAAMEDQGTIYYQKQWFKIWDSATAINGAAIGYQEQCAVSANPVTGFTQQENQVLQGALNISYLSGDIVYRLAPDVNGNGFFRLYLDNFFHGGGTVYTDQQAGNKDFTSGTALASQSPWSNPVLVTVDGGTANVRAMGVIIIPGVTVSLNVTSPTTASTGSAMLVSVTAWDGQNHLSTSYTGTVHFTSNDTAATLPANSTLSGGVGVFSVTFGTAGTRTVSAADINTASIHGISPNVTVSTGALPATHYFLGVPTDATSGTAAVFTITAEDQTGATVTGYTGVVHFTSSDTAATLPANTSLTNGVGTFSATFTTAGNQTITGTDVSTSITGVSSSVNVHATSLVLHHFAISSAATSIAATVSVLTVTAQTSGNATVTTYTGTVAFTSSDAVAKLPANGTLTNGTGVFSVTMTTPGSQTITASDSVTSSLTGHSAAIAVSGVYIAPWFINNNATGQVLHMGASHDGLNFYSWATTHTSQPAGAVVRDPNLLSKQVLGLWWMTYGIGNGAGNLASAGGQIGLSSSPDLANWTGITNNGCNGTIGPGAISFGSSGFNFSLVPAWFENDDGKVYITFAGANDSYGNGLLYVVSPTVQSDFTVAWNNPVQIAVGVVPNTVLAHSMVKYGGVYYLWFQYANGNWVPIASTTQPPANWGNNGAWTSLLTDNWLGVNAAYTSKIVSRLDCSGWAFFFSNASAGLIRTQNFSNADWTGGQTSNTSSWSNQSVIAFDGITSTGVLGPFTVVIPATPAFLGVAAISPAVLGSAVEIVVTAQDFAGLLSTHYSGTVHFTGGDTGAVLPANAILTNGVGLFSVTLNTHGTWNITATDVNTATITGVSAGITV